MNVDELNHQCGMDAIFGEVSHHWVAYYLYIGMVYW